MPTRLKKEPRGSANFHYVYRCDDGHIVEFDASGNDAQADMTARNECESLSRPKQGENIPK